MPIETIKLDDRTFQDIVDEAKTRIRQRAPGWTDHNVSDPGVMLVELFAWMTEMMLYRINRIPEKQYLTLLQLLGITREPPRPAQAGVTLMVSHAITSDMTDEYPIKEPAEVATLPTPDRPESTTFMIDAGPIVRSPGALTVRRALQGESTAENVLGGPPRPMFGQVGAAGTGTAGPREGDAVYFGFANDVTSHVIRLTLTFPDAAGEKAVGHDQRNPPIEWHAWCGEKGWVAAAVQEDLTAGFSNSGRIDIRLPDDMRPDRLAALLGPAQQPGGQDEFLLRCSYRPSVHNNRAYTRAPQLLMAQAAAAGITVQAWHVEQMPSEILGTSTAEPGQSFILPRAPVAPFRAGEAIEVEQADGSWQPWRTISVPDFSNSHGKNDVLVDFATGEVIFGPRIREPDGSAKQYGNIPPRGMRVRVTAHRYTPGAAAELPARSLRVLKKTIPHFHSETCNYEPARGRHLESIEHMKLRAPGLIRSGDRAVTAEDYVRLAYAAHDAIARVECIAPDSHSTSRTVTLLIVPKAVPSERAPIPAGALAIEDIRPALASYLEPRRMLTTRITIEAPQYRYVSVQVRFRLPQSQSKTTTAERRQQIEREALRRLYGFLNPLTGGSHGVAPGDGWQLGRALYGHDLLMLLQTVPGIAYIESINYALVAAPEDQPTNWAQAIEPTSYRGTPLVDVTARQLIASGRHIVEAT